MIHDHESIDVFIGVDVGKTNHHAVALKRAGKKLLDKALPQDETKLRDIIRSLAMHGRLLFVVDQPATIGALPVAVAQAEGILVGYLPGLSMRRVADLHPGEAKTDALDAFIIANAARALPQTLRSVQVADEQVAELAVHCGFDDDLATQATATSNRIRGLHLRSSRPWNGPSDRIWTTGPCPSWRSNTRRRRPTRGGQEGLGGNTHAQARTPGWGTLDRGDLHGPGRADRGRLRDLDRGDRAATTGTRPGPNEGSPRRGAGAGKKNSWRPTLSANS